MNNYEKKEKIIDEAKKETDTKLTDSIANESIKQIQKNQNKIRLFIRMCGIENRLKAA